MLRRSIGWALPLDDLDERGELQIVERLPFDALQFDDALRIVFGQS